MNLVGKSLDQIRDATRNKSRGELQQLLYEYSTLEPMFTPAELAVARRMSKRVIIQKIKAREIRAHKPIDNGYRVPLSGIREWDAETALVLKQPKEEIGG